MTPYKTAAPIYQAAGWTGIIPLPPAKKDPPPTGYTGWNGKDPKAKMIDMWRGETTGNFQAASNIAIHMPDDCIGIDVDHYNGKIGGATLAQLEQELGPLPPTYISTARNGGVSGIRWFRTEPGLRWPTGPGKDIEFVHKGHRYAVVWPSIHPEGGQYVWVDHSGSRSEPPEPDNLAELPWEWVARFTGGEKRTEQPEYRRASDDERAQCLTEGPMCYATTKALNKFEDRLTVQARHDSALKTVMALCRLGEQSHKGVNAAVAELKDRFVNLVTKDRADGTEGPEYQRMVDGGIVKVLAEPTSEQDKGCCGANSGDQPRADVRNAAHAANWLREELGRGQLSGIFRRDDLLVHTPRIGEQGYLPPSDLGLIDAGPAQVRPITTIGVKSLIETRYQCWRTTTIREGAESTQIEVAALFPQQSAQSACEAARLGEYTPNLKTLHGVTHTPMMRPDGTILDVPGYDAATGFLYLPDPDLIVPPIPDRPTSEEIRGAVELILQPVAEFPFVTEDDRATWIGLAFTPALLPGPYQMGVITATNPGSGKTKLATMIRTIHGGVQRGELPRDADELRKSITAALMDTTAPVITFDNLTGVVRSSVLEALLTTKTWTDRWLGQNRSVTATNDRLWLATGNNAQFGGDLGRRIATVALNPPAADHHLRTDFRIMNLDGWLQAHRSDLLVAILTVARGWVNAGRPAKDVRSDDYAGWVKGLRGLMEWADFPGIFGGSTTSVAVSSDDEEWHAFLVALHKTFNTQPFTTKDLVGQLGDHDKWTGGTIDPAVLPGDLADRWAHVRDGRDGSFRQSLGHWLRNRQGRYAAGWAIVSATRDTHNDVARYMVKPPDIGSSDA
jgi:hypothetical protein